MKFFFFLTILGKIESRTLYKYKKKRLYLIIAIDRQPFELKFNSILNRNDKFSNYMYEINYKYHEIYKKN